MGKTGNKSDGMKMYKCKNTRSTEDDFIRRNICQLSTFRFLFFVLPSLGRVDYFFVSFSELAGSDEGKKPERLTLGYI